MKKIILISALLLSIAGCAVPTNITPMSTGGSKADGTVVMSYEVGALQEPVINWTAAEADAKKRCTAWGYKKAIPFGGNNNVCLAHNGYGHCMRMRVDTTYQCTNK